MEPENAREYADAILVLTEDAKLRDHYGEQGCEHARAHYSRASKARAFAAILDKVVHRPKHS